MRKALLTLVEKILRRVRGILRRVQQTGPRTIPTCEIAIVIVVSDEIHNCMRRIQLEIVNRYGDSSGIRTSPHITLKQAVLESGVERFERYFDYLVTDIEPFEICIKGVDSFENNILFLDVEPNPRLEVLRQRVLKDLSEKFGVAPSFYEGDQYHFHATLAYALSRDKLAAERKRLARVNTEFRFTVDSLGLVIGTGNGWTTYKRARLSMAVAESLHRDRG